MCIVCIVFFGIFLIMLIMVIVLVNGLLVLVVFCFCWFVGLYSDSDVMLSGFLLVVSCIGFDSVNMILLGLVVGFCVVLCLNEVMKFFVLLIWLLYI